MSRLNPRICVEQCEIRGEDFNAASWECGLHLLNGHHSTISNCHIIGHTGECSRLAHHRTTHLCHTWWVYLSVMTSTTEGLLHSLQPREAPE